MEEIFFDLLGKRVKIIDDDNNVFIGRAYTFTPRIDTDDNIAELGILRENEKGIAYVFRETDVLSIEIIE